MRRRTGECVKASPAGIAASEGQACGFYAAREVRYGENSQFNYRTTTDIIVCSNANFGDLIYGVVKECAMPMLEQHVSWLNDRGVGLHVFLGCDGSRNSGPCWDALSDAEKRFYLRYVVSRPGLARLL